jgi:hypothetical protein
MTAVLSAAIGLALGAALLHVTLAMCRPVDRAHLYFASMMVFIALNFYFGLDLYSANSVEAAVAAMRLQMMAILGCHGYMLLLVPAYAKVRLPRPLMAVYWVGLIMLAVANLWTPYGLMFSAEPELVQAALYGTPFTVVVAAPTGLLQQAYAFYFTSFLIISLACAVSVFRRGERERGLVFGVAILLILATNTVDFIRDATGGSRPYVGEYGFVAWAVIMSVQLARDFRAQARTLRDAIQDVELQGERSRSMLEALRTLEHDIHAPLERLEIDVAALTAATTRDEAHLQRLRRVAARLRELARSMPVIDTEQIGKSPT